MATRLSDSSMYRHLWTAPELDHLFDEPGRLACWLAIVQALAAAQAEVGLIPAGAATAICAVDAGELDIDYIAEQTRETSHSTLGFIRGLARVLPADVHRHVYYGATVQDVTDTWFAMVMRDVGDRAAALVRDIRANLIGHALTHRDTVMAGRTHGQLGAPITFGFKVASWVDELTRHLDRLAEGRRRWACGQLGGAVGVLAFFGPDGLRLRTEFCRRLGLDVPATSWLTSRDRVAEFGHTLAMICATLGRIGGEIYELQRPEIGELSEPSRPGVIGSITMPHKRNPEGSEHLITLARLTRAGCLTLLEGMDQQHERDGRGWKAEWVALPELCELTTVALGLARTIVAGLSVDPAAMRANLDAQGGRLASEQLLVRLADHFGKHEAQSLLQDALAAAGGGADLVARLLARGVAVSEPELRDLVQSAQLGVAGEQVDAVVAAATAAGATGRAG